MSDLALRRLERAAVDDPLAARRHQRQLEGVGVVFQAISDREDATLLVDVMVARQEGIQNRGWPYNPWCFCRRSEMPAEAHRGFRNAAGYYSDEDWQDFEQSHRRFIARKLRKLTPQEIEALRRIEAKP